MTDYRPGHPLIAFHCKSGAYKRRCGLCWWQMEQFNIKGLDVDAALKPLQVPTTGRMRQVFKTSPVDSNVGIAWVTNLRL
jgi:hypothetical protein